METCRPRLGMQLAVEDLTGESLRELFESFVQGLFQRLLHGCSASICQEAIKYAQLPDNRLRLTDCAAILKA
jgi:hypothetical protein